MTGSDYLCHNAVRPATAGSHDLIFSVCLSWQPVCFTTPASHLLPKLSSSHPQHKLSVTQWANLTLHHDSAYPIDLDRFLSIPDKPRITEVSKSSKLDDFYIQVGFIDLFFFDSKLLGIQSLLLVQAGRLTGLFLELTHRVAGIQALIHNV